MDADVVIVGTGPAGGMAACRLAASGLKTLVLEQRTLPRPKPCGGAMPSRVTQVIDWDFEALIESRVHAVRNLYNYSLEQVAPTVSPILMVSRPQFDQYLIERALTLGKGDVQLRESVRVASVVENAAGVEVRSASGDVIHARYLIAGDGAYSKVARGLGLNRDVQSGVALDAEVEVSPEVYAVEGNRATFNYFCLPTGYGWIFPKNGHLSCGVGAWRGNVHVRQALDDFLARSFPAGSVRRARITAHAIPLYSGPRTIATSRVCLVGDAANLVDPILGEGIRFAMLSGQLAADVVTRLCGVSTAGESESGSEVVDCRDYQTAVRRVIGEPLGSLFTFATPIFVKAPEFFYRKFVMTGQSYFGLSRQLTAALKTLAARP